MGYHAVLSPSSAHRWTDCTASVGAQAGRPNTTSEASRLGTCAHQLSAECLEHGHDPQTYLGRIMAFPDGAEEHWADDPMVTATTVTVDQEMVDAARKYIGFVRDMTETLNAQLIVEQQVPIGAITGESDGRGTADSVLLADDLLVTVDAKFGRSRVTAYDVIEPARLDPLTQQMQPPKLRMNLQLALYLLGALEKYEFMGDFKRVKAVIVQPYLNAVSEYECSVEELRALGMWLKERADATRKNPEFSPSNDNCFFCKAKFDCVARTRVVLATALDGFEDIDNAKPKVVGVPELGQLLDKLDMIESWVQDIRDKALIELQAGRPILRPDGLRYKLVEGRKGHKAWSDEAEAEKLMERFRLGKLMWKKTLITPAAAQKFATPVKAKKGEEPVEPLIGKTQWNRLSSLIEQPPGKPTVVLETDPRPEMQLASTGLEEVPPADNSDLF